VDPKGFAFFYDSNITPLATQSISGLRIYEVYEFAKQVKEMLSELKIILTRGYNEEESAFEELKFTKNRLNKSYA
jgi:hypothetical protein